ncbi:MAG: 4Fe-4S binding protein [Armatimonadota bacterium]
MADGSTRPPLYLRVRLWVQFAAAFLVNALFLYDLRGICVPVLNCWSCPVASFACPMGAFQQGVAAMRGALLLPFYVLGSILVASAIMGRSMCGWLCPFGLVQDLMGKLRKRRARMPRVMGYLKYVILIVLGIILPYLTFEPWFCKFCPQGALEGGIFMPIVDPDLREWIAGMWYTKLGILVAFLVAAIFVRRPFCHSFCALGALFSVCNRVSLIRMHYVREECTDCMWCVKACPAGIDPRTDLNGNACITCMECAKCPFDAIHVSTAVSRCSGCEEEHIPAVTEDEGR